jgi:hypothetical protein
MLVRVHSGCLTADVLGSLRCDCREQLHRAMEIIQKDGRGVLLYLNNQEGRGIGLLNKIQVPMGLQDSRQRYRRSELCSSAFKADLRDLWCRCTDPRAARAAYALKLDYQQSAQDCRHRRLRLEGGGTGADRDRPPCRQRKISPHQKSQARPPLEKGLAPLQPVSILSHPRVGKMRAPTA